MIISICPTFFCNNNCNYCYLGKKRLSKQLLNINLLYNKLKEIQNIYYIDGIDIFGGEISLLDKDYLISLNQICKKFTPNINITTNLTNDLSFIFDNISISLNEERDDYNFILNKLKTINYIYSLNIVILKSIINQIKKNNHIDFFSKIPKNCKSIYYIKYYPSIYMTNKINISDIEYEQTLIKIILDYKKQKYNFELQNLNYLNKKPSTSFFSNIFILPNSNYAIISYDKNNLEYFNEFSNITDFNKYCLYQNNNYLYKCGTCNYFGNCYTEHINLNKKCSGHKNILKKFESCK